MRICIFIAFLFIFWEMGCVKRIHPTILSINKDLPYTISLLIANQYENIDFCHLSIRFDDEIVFTRKIERHVDFYKIFLKISLGMYDIVISDKENKVFYQDKLTLHENNEIWLILRDNEVIVRQSFVFG